MSFIYIRSLRLNDNNNSILFRILSMISYVFGLAYGFSQIQRFKLLLSLLSSSLAFKQYKAKTNFIYIFNFRRQFVSELNNIVCYNWKIKVPEPRSV